MQSAQILFRVPGATMTIGSVPLVVGTVTSLPADANRFATEAPCDIVELRLDKMRTGSDWVACGRAIQAARIPVILTIRSKVEGGSWSGSESERRKLFE